MSTFSSPSTLAAHISLSRSTTACHISPRPTCVALCVMCVYECALSYVQVYVMYCSFPSFYVFTFSAPSTLAIPSPSPIHPLSPLSPTNPRVSHYVWCVYVYTLSYVHVYVSSCIHPRPRCPRSRARPLSLPISFSTSPDIYPTPHQPTCVALCVVCVYVCIMSYVHACVVVWHAASDQ